MLFIRLLFAKYVSYLLLQVIFLVECNELSRNVCAGLLVRKKKQRKRTHSQKASKQTQKVQPKRTNRVCIYYFLTSSIPREIGLTAHVV